MNATQKAYLQLHLAVLLFGFTAILGKWISLNALALVWWRVLLTSLSLLALVKIGTLFQDLSRRQMLVLMGIGCIVGSHWVAFYGAIKLSNASIGVISMATTSLFSALLEPLILKRKFDWLEFGLSLLIIPGMWLVVNGIDVSMITGLLVGLFSAFLAALFTILNKSQVGKVEPLRITFVELGSATLFLSPMLLFNGFQNGFAGFWPLDGIDWMYLLILVLLCTTLGYVLALNALKHLSAFTSNLTMNLEPVYGVVLAWVLLQENKEMSPGFYWGAALIMVVVFSYPLLKKRFGEGG
jgi:drug/metabolite transporter (DMT)-like permease